VTPKLSIVKRTIMDKIKWRQLNKDIILELRKVLKDTGCNLQLQDADTLPNLIKELEDMEFSPAVAMELRFQSKLGLKGADRGQGSSVPKVKLHPQGKEEKLEEFLRRFNTWIEVCNIKDAQRMEKFWEAASPEVGLAMTMMGGDKTDFEEVQAFLKAQFKITPEAQLKRFRQERKNKEESFVQFGQRLKAYLIGYLELKPEEFETMVKGLVPMILEQLVAGVSDRVGDQVRRKLAGEKTDFARILRVFDEEADLATEQWEKAKRRSSNREQRAKAPQNEQPLNGELQCNSCGNKGHGIRDCRGPVKCFRCSKAGHIARDCPGN
jgi:hypothetical protein